MLLEALIVAMRLVVAEMGAAALGASYRRLQNSLRNSAQCKPLEQATASLPLRSDLDQASRAGGLSNQPFLQRGLLAEQTGMGPHRSLQLDNCPFHSRVFSC